MVFDARVEDLLAYPRDYRAATTMVRSGWWLGIDAPFAAGERGFEGADVIVVTEEAAVAGLILLVALGAGGFFNA